MHACISIANFLKSSYYSVIVIIIHTTRSLFVDRIFTSSVPLQKGPSVSAEVEQSFAEESFLPPDSLVRFDLSLSLNASIDHKWIVSYLSYGCNALVMYLLRTISLIRYVTCGYYIEPSECQTMHPFKDSRKSPFYCAKYSS